MIRDDILQLLRRTQRQYTATEIALKIDSSHGRVCAILKVLYDEGLVTYTEIKDQGTYAARWYYVWELQQ